MYRAILEMNEAMVAGLCHQSCMLVVRLRDCGRGMWAWMWEMYLLFPAQMLACFITTQITGLFALHTETAGHRTAWILRHPGTLQVQAVWACTFAECLGGASLLEFLAFFCVLAIFVCWPSGRSISMPCEIVSKTDTEKEDML